MVVAGSILTPSANAESFQSQNQLEQKKAEVISQIQQQPIPNSFKSSSFAAKDVSVTADYKNQINMYETHEYFFTTGGGRFTVKDFQPENQDIDFVIYNYQTDQEAEPSAEGGYDLQPGAYDFTVLSTSDKLTDYEYTLDGSFSEEPDTTLPAVRVDYLPQHVLALPKSTNPVFQIKGSSSADYLTFSTYTSDQELSMDSQGYFGTQLNLQRGDNHFSMYALKEGGNAVLANYSVYLAGLTRISGKNRYEVSSNISKELTSRGSISSGTVIIARGDVFSDALSGGPLATAEDSPILLTETQSLPQTVKDEIKSSGADRAIILGGTGSVSLNVESELRSLGITAIERVAGKDRYAVAAQTAERVAKLQDSDTVIIASGLVFPDALSASSIAGPQGMPILLVNPSSVPEDIKTFLKNHAEIKHFIVVGGSATVNDTVISQVKSITAGAAVERISGSDRYQVSINTAEYGIAHYGMDVRTLAFARGDLFPDALSGAPLANLYSAPILLTKTDALESKVQAFLKKYEYFPQHIYIWGGTGSISSYEEQQLNEKIN